MRYKVEMNAHLFVKDEGDLVRAFGNFALLRTDYDLKLASVAGGALKTKDEIKFSFDIVPERKSRSYVLSHTGTGGRVFSRSTDYCFDRGGWSSSQG
jgi:hypothetical protein